jgi:L-serine dehydratase
MSKSDNNNDELFPELPELKPQSSNIDRRTFIIRNAVIGAAAVMTGTTWTREARAAQAAKEATKEAGHWDPPRSHLT